MGNHQDVDIAKSVSTCDRLLRFEMVEQRFSGDRIRFVSCEPARLSGHVAQQSAALRHGVAWVLTQAQIRGMVIKAAITTGTSAMATVPSHPARK